MVRRYGRFLVLVVEPLLEALPGVVFVVVLFFRVVLDFVVFVVVGGGGFCAFAVVGFAVVEADGGGGFRPVGVCEGNKREDWMCKLERED